MQPQLSSNYLICLAAPEGTTLAGASESGRCWLKEGTLRVGCLESCGIRVAGLQPRSRASYLIFETDANGTSRVYDSGHNFQVLVNGVRVDSGRRTQLAEGDVIEPCMSGWPLGLRFRFHHATGG